MTEFFHCIQEKKDEVHAFHSGKTCTFSVKMKICIYFIKNM